MSKHIQQLASYILDILHHRKTALEAQTKNKYILAQTRKMVNTISPAQTNAPTLNFVPLPYSLVGCFGRKFFWIQALVTKVVDVHLFIDHLRMCSITIQFLI